jgi:AbrB family looped-hinge helix DNA binding protein
MSLPRSKVTSGGRISIPAEIRHKLGIGPGSVLEWEVDGENVVVRRARLYSFEDMHRALFDKPPRRRSDKELKQGIVRYIRDKHPRR